jgi:subtilase family serine protease
MTRLAAACFALAATMLTAATLASPQQVLLTGRTFHVRACGDVQVPGYARCHAHLVTDSRGAVYVQRNTTAAPSGGYAPADLRSAYGVTTAGAGSTVVAVIDAYGYANAEADLGVYRARYGLPACTSANGCFTKLNESGAKGPYPVANTGWAQETALDLDMVSAMCPNCRIVLIEANSSSLTDLARAVNLAAALGARVISNSYGGAETGTQALESAYNHPGIAITASSGDNGYGVAFPASSPHVTAVGGTSLYRAATTRGWSESAWSDAGSGCSTTYLKPTWQHDPLCTRRMVADVAAIADPSTGVLAYGPASATASGWLIFGGTSVAAPLIAGVYGVNVGAVTYGSSPYANAASLNDVTSGANGVCGGIYFCKAGPGYDGPTGLGTPKGVKAF